MIHLTPYQISSFLDGELNEASTEIVRLHLVSCDQCTLSFARAEEQADQLARVLTHDPGPDYFTNFASDVEDLVRADKTDSRVKPQAARAVPAPRTARVRQTPPAPREPEPKVEPKEQPAAAAVAAVVQEDTPAAPLPAVQPKSIFAPTSHRRREGDRRPVPTIPWYAAAILVVIAGSVGVMVSRSPLLDGPPEDAHRASDPTAFGPAFSEQGRDEPVPADQTSAPLPIAEPPPVEQAPPSGEPPVPAAGVAAPPPSKPADEEPGPVLVPEPMKTLMPVTRIVTVVETTRTGSTPPPRPAVSPSLPKRVPAAPAEKDPFATLLAEINDRVRAAQKASARAAEDPTALNYETAASRWEDVVSDLRGHAAQPRARFQLASARYRAWEMHPNAQRAAAAVASLRLYLVFAAPSAERDSAKAWLARLSH